MCVILGKGVAEAVMCEMLFFLSGNKKKLCLLERTQLSSKYTIVNEMKEADAFLVKELNEGQIRQVY